MTEPIDGPLANPDALASAGAAKVDRPEVQMQDVEHQPRAETRVPNAGVEVVHIREGRKAKVVLEEFDRGVRSWARR
jgi:hypothetical protein